ncbi:protein of unknown function [Collimonas sp. OK242]|jgi:hypothetical protein|uniref:DUF4194 domain-containing protein n=1 Tax=Collimonas sp. OK242 TaxID=1798195 RepID=UPI00089BD3D9|nr:DUF4194 domain-containing protein [Collimonas sp. OK242]SDX81725.1 protein of unknown function [Collimonas sp. OK242]
MTLNETLNEQLALHNLPLERFREIVGRLFAAGIVIREEDGVEQRLYDDARRIEACLSDYFQLGGFRLEHNLKGEFFRLYAPGAEVPGMPEDGLDPVPGLRARLSPDFVAAALALRFQYQQGLADGGNRLTDSGEVLTRFEELSATLQTQLKRALPPTNIERQRLLNDLKRHRLIRLAPNFSMDDEDALLAIRPTILGIISDDMLEAALESEPLQAGAEVGPETEQASLHVVAEPMMEEESIEGNIE